MKKLLVLILSICVLYSCKNRDSSISSLVEQDNDIFYLFGASSGENNTPIICKYSCTELPTQTSKKSVCSSPVYIKESVLQNSDLSGALPYIKNNDQILVRKFMDPDKEVKISSLFTKAEEEKLDNKYDPTIGDPDVVCSSILNVTSSGMITNTSSTTTKIDMKIQKLVSCPFIVLNQYQKEIGIIKGDLSKCINKDALKQYGYTYKGDTDYKLSESKEKEFVDIMEKNKDKIIRDCKTGYSIFFADVENYKDSIIRTSIYYRTGTAKTNQGINFYYLNFSLCPNDTTLTPEEENVKGITATQILYQNF